MLAITMKQARVGANMTQKEVAEKLGVHYTTYWKMEKHPEDMSIKQATKFADIVGVDFEDIVFFAS